jgi:methionine-rich copper-binding protein CopC
VVNAWRRSRWVAGAASVATLLLVIGLFGAPNSVAGHAYYSRSVPAEGAVLDSAPARVDVWFTEMLYRAGASHLYVIGPSGQDVDNNDKDFVVADQRNMYITLQPNLGPGTYTVEWETQSAKDGHTAEGSFIFTVTGGNPPPAATVPGGSTPPQPGSTATPAAPRGGSNTMPTPAGPAQTSGEGLAGGVPSAGGGSRPSNGEFAFSLVACVLALIGAGSLLIAGVWRAQRPRGC